MVPSIPMSIPPCIAEAKEEEESMSMPTCSPGSSEEEGSKEEENGEKNGDNEKSKKNDSNNDEKLKKIVESLNDDNRLIECVKYKEEGTIKFKEEDYNNALELYNKSEKYIIYKNNSKNNVDQDFINQEKALHISINLNICMAHIKLSQFHLATKPATNVLEKDPLNTKALYRRGLCYMNVGKFPEAKNDIQKLLKNEPTNIEAKKCLQDIKIKTKEQNLQAKQAYGGMFSKGGVTLYDDKEKEREKKLAEEEVERKQKREQWHQEMNVLQEKGESEIPFDTWVDQKAKEIKEKDEADEAARVAKQKKSSEKSINLAGGKTELDHNMLDEEDQKILDETKKMGYCYFRRDMSAEEQRINSLNKPKKMEKIEEPSPEKITATDLKSLSSWNSRGTTYEEKDTTSWCISNFEKAMANVSFSSDPKFSPENLVEKMMSAGTTSDPEAMKEQLLADMFHPSIKTDKVRDISGEGVVSVIRGTKRYLFDLHAVIDFSICIQNPMATLPIFNNNNNNKDNSNSYNYKGELRIIDMSSAKPSENTWLEDSTTVYSSTIQKEHKKLVNEVVASYKAVICTGVDEFLKLYKETF